MDLNTLDYGTLQENTDQGKKKLKKKLLGGGTILYCGNQLFLLFRVWSRDEKGEEWEETGREEGWGRTIYDYRKN